MQKVHEFFGYNWATIQQLLIKIGTNLLLAVFIFLFGFWVANYLGRLVKKILVKSNTDLGLTTFLTSLSTVILKALVLVTGLSQLGIAMTSFVAILGAAGLAIGLAFSGTLSNFAGGVMILIFKPFKIGETIKALNETGEVKEIQIFNTWLRTSDNKVVVLPNGPVANGVIVNFSREPKRRVELIFGVSPNEDLEKVKEILLEVATQDDKILKTPAPFVGLGEMKDNQVQVHLKVWTKTENTATLSYTLNTKLYKLFNEAKIDLTNNNQY